MEEWFAGYVNSSRRIRGGVFTVDENRNIVWKRRRRHFIGHRDEIARWCFKYEVRCKLDTKKNQLIAWVFNYRNPSDIDMLPDALRF